MAREQTAPGQVATDQAAAGHAAKGHAAKGHAAQPQAPAWQPPRRLNLAQAMPQTAAWVAEQRALHGDAWVSEQVRRGMAGEPGRFYAIEAGHIAGTPWPASHPMDEIQRFALVYGCKSAAFLKQPEADHVAH